MDCLFGIYLNLLKIGVIIQTGWFYLHEIIWNLCDCFKVRLNEKVDNKEEDNSLWV